MKNINFMKFDISTNSVSNITTYIQISEYNKKKFLFLVATSFQIEKKNLN